MPLQLVSRDDTNEANQRTMTGYLEESLGLDLKQSKIVSRKFLGSIVHVFSHIRLTLNVEMLCLTVSHLPSNEAPAASAQLFMVDCPAPVQHLKGLS